MKYQEFLINEALNNIPTGGFAVSGNAHSLEESEIFATKESLLRWEKKTYLGRVGDVGSAIDRAVRLSRTLHCDTTYPWSG